MDPAKISAASSATGKPGLTPALRLASHRALEAVTQQPQELQVLLYQPEE